MSNTRVRLNLRGINKVMSGHEAQRAVNEAAYRLNAKAGPGHEVVVEGKKPHPWVARAFVQQDDVAQTKRDPNGLALLNALT